MNVQKNYKLENNKRKCGILSENFKETKNTIN